VAITTRTPSATANTAAGSASTLTVGYATGTAAGDLVVQAVNADGNNTVIPTAVGPAALSKFDLQQGAGNTSRLDAWRGATVSGDLSTAPAFNTTATRAMVGAVCAFTGATWESVTDGTQVVATTGTAPSVTPTVDNSLILIIASTRAAATNTAYTTTDPAGFTRLAGDQTTVTSTGRGGLYVWAKQLGTGTGGVATGTFALASTTSVRWVTAVVVLAPSATDGLITATAATVALTSPPPGVVGVRNATVTGVVATVAASAPAPTVNGIRNTNTASVAATVSASAPPPTITTGASVSAAAAAVTLAAVAPTVTAASAGGAVAVPATVGVVAAAPAVTAVRNATVTPPVAGVTTTTQAPSVAAAQGGTVSATTATVTLLAPAPAVTGNASVTAAHVVITWTANAPTVTAGATVQAAPATVTVLTHPASVRGNAFSDRDITVTYTHGTDRWVATIDTSRWASTTGADRWGNTTAADRWEETPGTDRWTSRSTP
jgi:hypothetical protein